MLINDRGEAVISDFGRAKLVEDDVYSLSLIAAAAWTAPELLDMNKGEIALISIKSDVWALGMTTLEVRVIRFPGVLKASVLTPVYRFSSCIPVITNYGTASVPRRSFAC